MSRAIQFLLNNIITKIIIVNVIVITSIIMILSAIIHFFTMDDGTYKEGDSSNVPYAVQADYIKNVKFGENGIYFEKEEKKDDGTVEKSILTYEDIWNDLVKNGSCVTDYLNTPDELAKLMNAQVVTQFPFLPGLAEDKLNGTVTFERHTIKDDGTEDIKTLEYINQDSFKSMVDSDDMTVLNKFTLDDNNNLLIAVKDRTTETVTYNDSEMKLEEYSQSLKEENRQGDNTYSSVAEHVTSRTVNYQNAISKYVMPFQYLWSFLVISDCEDFVLELADLVNDSQITIAIFDNITTTETTEINEYKKQRRVDKYASLYVSPTGVIDKSTERYWVQADNPNYGGYTSNETIDGTTYQITHTSTYETNTPSFEVTHANVWMMELIKEYEAEKKDNPSSNTNTLPNLDYQEDGGSPQDSNGNSGLLNDGDVVSFKNEYKSELQRAINANEKRQNDRLSEAAKANNTTAQTVTHTEASVSVSYVKINSYTKQIDRVKTINTNTITRKYTTKSTNKPREKIEKNTDEENFVNILCKPEYTNARTQIFRIVDWLFDLLEENPDTVNMIDLTKYLFNKVLGRDEFDTDFKFDEYEPGSINNISLGSGGASYESLNLTESDLQILYKITFAERGDGTQEQQEYVVSVILNRVLSSKFPNTVYDVVFAPYQFEPTRNGAYDRATPTSTTIAAVDNVVKTGDKSKCAVYFMTPAASIKPSQKWLNNCEYLFNDSDEGLRNTNTGGSHNFYTTQEVKDELQQYMTQGNGSIVESAISIHKYVRERGFRYAQAGITVPNANGSTIDCSSYVTWVLLNSHVEGFTEGMYQWTSSSFNCNPYGWQEIPVNEAQPGDILVYSGHVEIVAATGADRFIVYNCGGNSSIMAAGTSELPESSTSGRSKSSIIKILRVP